MEGLAITHRGFEDSSAKEIKELIKTKPEQKDTAIVFDIKKYEDLCLLAYKAQSTTKILLLLSQFTFKNQDEFLKKAKKLLKKTDFSDWLGEEVSFRISIGHAPDTEILKDFEAELGGIVIDNIKKYEQKVNLDNPDIKIYFYVCNGTAYLGIDFSGIDTSKRDYKIFNISASLKGTIGYCLLRFAGYEKGKTLLDPFSGAGIIPIEAARFSLGFPNNFYFKDRLAFLKMKNLSFDVDKFFEKVDKKITSDKPHITGYAATLRDVKGAQKNAKIGGVNKRITFSKISVEWLDTKLDKESVDMIVTRPPSCGKRANVKEIQKEYDELFYQSEFILKKEGVVALISEKKDMLLEAAQKKNFKLKEEREVWHGLEKDFVLLFSKYPKPL